MPEEQLDLHGPRRWAQLWDRLSEIVWQEEDLFRRVIQGWSVVEDAFEEAINGMLVEPFLLSGAAFRHKLNLAIGLGIVAPESRDPFAALARVRNQLAHGDREPEDIPGSEFEDIALSLGPPLVWEGPKLTDADFWSMNALAFAYTAVATGSEVARETREQEQTALRRELDARTLPPGIEAVLQGRNVLGGRRDKGEPSAE